MLCVPFTLLYTMKEEIQVSDLPITLGAENVSPFPEGAETGEESARMVKDLVDWVIIGHSERRKNLGETDELLFKKVVHAKEAGLHVIYCVQNELVPVPSGVDGVAYEPVSAIGTGVTDSPENANNVIEHIKEKTRVSMVLYGGSITSANVASFVGQPSIDGVLVGGASLDSEKFVDLIANVQ
jgi:triosephosphate isomerase